MSWLGKVVGGTFGFLMAGPLGAILGAAIGHQFDAELEIDENLNPGHQQRVQMAFFTATFSVMGHIAKVDGRVSQAEINLANKIMNEMGITGGARETAIKLFQQGKKPNYPINEVLAQFRRECHRRTNLIRMFIEIQLQAAFADGAIKQTEEGVLLNICEQLRISRVEYETIKLQFQAQQRFYDRHPQSVNPQRNILQDAYAVLGLKPSASDAEVTKAYRRLISRHHPDKLVAKGLPEEMMLLAKEKTQKIRKAYETIRAARKF